MKPEPPIDLLATFARFAQERGTSLRDPKLADAFTRHVKDALASAVSNDALLHGQRTQHMFEAMIVSLGQYSLLKPEDFGVVHPEGKFIAPDFRVILRDGSQWLVEVKNVRDTEPRRQRFRMRAQDFAKLQNYASAMKCPLKFALYWSLWRVWTLIDAQDLIADGDKLGIEMPSAVPLSRLSQLGDRTIGTTPPIKLRLIADTSKPRVISPSGKVTFTIGNVAFYSGDTLITDTTEREIAWIFMLYGDWQCSPPEPLISDGQLNAIQFEWLPVRRPNADENFEMIGTISSMFSRYYATQTLGDEGVLQTQTELKPGWLAPLVTPDEPRTTLPLWRFSLSRRELTSTEAS